MIPILLLTYNRLEYTKQALKSLMYSDCGEITVIDQNSTDGTREYLSALFDKRSKKVKLVLNETNRGIAGAMNQFLELTKTCGYVGKVDSDTIVPTEWCSILLRKMIRFDIDILQARHPIIPAVYYGKSFDEWTKTMKREPTDKTIFYNSFVGGSGVIFKRNAVDHIPETADKLYGWRQFQREHPELKKAFCTEVSVDLLDAHGYNDYESYYKQTGRIA